MYDILRNIHPTYSFNVLILKLLEIIITLNNQMCDAEICIIIDRTN